jgi:hypothetical protein
MSRQATAQNKDTAEISRIKESEPEKNAVVKITEPLQGQFGWDMM